MSNVILVCPKCGEVVSFNDNVRYGFCIRCGTKMTNDAEISKHVSEEYIERMKDYLRSAKRAYDSGDYSKALEFADKAIKIDPMHPEGWLYKGIIGLRQGCDPFESLQYLGKARSYSENRELEFAGEDERSVLKMSDRDVVINLFRSGFFDSINGLYRHAGRYLRNKGLDCSMLDEFSEKVKADYPAVCRDVRYRRYCDALVQRIQERSAKCNSDVSKDSWLTMSQIIKDDIPVLFVCQCLYGCYEKALYDVTYHLSEILDLKWKGLAGSKVKGVSASSISAAREEIAALLEWSID